MMTFRAICFIHRSVGWVVPGDLYSTQRPDGDLNPIIDYDPETKTTFRLMQIEEEISPALGIPVTITTRDALHPLTKDNTEREVVRVTLMSKDPPIAIRHRLRDRRHASDRHTHDPTNLPK
jgi:hypothetical protein